MNDAPDDHPIADPTLRRMLKVATAEFDGASGDGGTRAVVLGDLSVARVGVDPTESAPGIVSQRLVEALNQALRAAREGPRIAMLAIPGLDTNLRNLLSGDAGDPVEEMGADVDISALDRDFHGSDGDVSVTVAGLTQRVSSIHLPDLSEATLSLVPRAANRALAAAQLGRDGAVPLDEQADDILESLDEKMSAIESKLDGVEDVLDALARDLGL